MTELEQALIDRGLDPEDVTFVVDQVEGHNASATLNRAAQFIHLVFLRVGRDSPAGCALRRALGFSSEASLSRAANDFLVSKQYLHDLQCELEAQLGELSFAPTAKKQQPADGRAGPPGRPARHR